MAGVLFGTGFLPLLRERNGDPSGSPPSWVKLFTAVSPAFSQNSVYANFTWASGMGYADAALSYADWSYSFFTSYEHAVFSKVWTFSAGAGMSVLGYVVSDAGNTRVLFGEQFASAVVIPAGGGSLTLTVTDTYQQC